MTFQLPRRTSVQKYAVGQVEKSARLGLGGASGGAESGPSGPTVLKALSCHFKIKLKPDQCSLDIMTTAHRRTDSEVVVTVAAAHHDAAGPAALPAGALRIRCGHVSGAALGRRRSAQADRCLAKSIAAQCNPPGPAAAATAWGAPPCLPRIASPRAVPRFAPREVWGALEVDMYACARVCARA